MNKRSEKKPVIRLLFLGLVAMSLLLTIVPRARTVYDLNKQKISLEQQKEELVQQNGHLQETMNEVDSPENMEKIAREQLGLVKEGETVIIPILPDESSTVNP